MECSSFYRYLPDCQKFFDRRRCFLRCMQPSIPRTRHSVPRFQSLHFSSTRFITRDTVHTGAPLLTFSAVQFVPFPSAGITTGRQRMMDQPRVDKPFHIVAPLINHTRISMFFALITTWLCLPRKIKHLVLSSRHHGISKKPSSWTGERRFKKRERERETG